ncbi:MAG: DUF3429 domain-containing protein [Burkholderiales bacterium]|nr:DUF3429 domain-containing protein [Burkholderiales bacterium]
MLRSAPILLAPGHAHRSGRWQADPTRLPLSLERIAPSDTRANTVPPRLVGWLGYGGLLPFVGLAVARLMGLGPAGTAGNALIAYGAVILSFVGALHWAFAMTLPALSADLRQGRYAWSVLPSLVAWVALLLPAVAGALLLAATFLLHLWQDHRLAKAADAALPAWYLPLRWRLTAVAVACLASVALR